MGHLTLKENVHFMILRENAAQIEVLYIIKLFATFSWLIELFSNYCSDQSQQEQNAR